jgi:polysaccharide deacetylase 2 family uncharacterized protein YibQ
VRHFFYLLLGLSSLTLYANASQIAIVIDDIGYRQSDTAVLDIPGNITYSVLPHTPLGKVLALQAREQNKEVILHIPMEADNGKTLGPGALTSDMSEQGIRASLKASFAEIPFAVGINNHMGSRLTRLYHPMAWTMRFLKENNYLFLDSVTTEKSKAERVARYFGVPSLHRHVFLDNKLQHDYISRQFQQLIRISKRYNSAVAIAHPHPQTVASLKILIPMLKANGIDLVPLSQLLPNKNINQALTISTD